MISFSLTDKKMIAKATASMLLEIEAVHGDAKPNPKLESPKVGDADDEEVWAIAAQDVITE
ncbi:MAG: hypothetical protein ACPHAP_01040, partial [Candidatus Puniceispirillaceae bacterium]